MVAYCQSDAVVLKAGCEIFQLEFVAKANFNPMKKYVTIASACMWYYRKTICPPVPWPWNPPADGMGKEDNNL